ncbi:hypothetical protein B0H21DRAFT_686159 [Amylocystis lapponica]|nr:hypothetical protein B0H21DRAFT_686159 [Amylocystis lapponica]
METDTAPGDSPAVPTASSPDEEQRQYLEREINKHLHIFLVLRTQLNTLAPIARLPPELLSEIFLEHAIQCEAEHDKRPKNVYIAYYAWVRVTHVCRHWHDVATHCPRLWNRILVTRAQWAQPMLDRSKSLPLSVKAVIPDSPPERGWRYNWNTGRVRAERKMEAMQLILTALPRIRHFSINARKDLLEKMWPAVNGPAPLLRTLFISYVDEGRRWTEDDVSIPTALLSDQLPDLQQVELRLCVFRWRKETFPATLRSLIITRPRGPLPVTADMLSILENLPLLEHLALEHAIPIITEDFEFVGSELKSVEHIVPLPHLRVLCLTSLLMTDCAHLLHHLSFPPSTMLALHGGFESVEGAVVLASVLATKLAGAEPLRMLSVQRDGIHGALSTEGLCMLGSRTVCAFDAPPPPPSLELAFSALANAHYVTVAETLCARLPLAHVAALQVATRRLAFPALPHAWLDAFAQIAGLARLRASAASADGLFAALCWRTGDAADADAELFLPRLQTLELDSVWFGSEDRTKREFAVELQRCLAERRERGAPIRELVLTDCVNMNAEDVEPLKELVEVVRWDGSVQFVPDEEDNAGFAFPHEEFM